jgi:beta-glucosidase
LLVVGMVGCGSSSSKSDGKGSTVDQAALWKAAVAKATAVVETMTPAQQEALLEGQNVPAGRFAAGYIPSLTVGTTVVPDQYLCDSPNGVGNFNTGVTRFPTGITVAATWDRTLAKAYGDALGAEWFGKGCTHGLGPAMNIIRLPYGGRSAEYYSEDPFLAGAIGSSEVLGIQGQHVVATVKHFAANSQETVRSGSNSVMSERTLREIYLPAFERSVGEGGAGAVMCSYNKINGAYACENEHVGKEILRDDWGFSGVNMTDWGASHSTVASMNGALDLEMPGAAYYGMLGTYYAPSKLDAAVQAGTLTPDQLKQAAIHVLAALYKVGTFDQTWSSSGDVSTDAHKALAEELSAAGTVLLKNVGAALPLDGGNSSLKIAVIGGAADADAQSAIGGSGVVSASEAVVTPLAGIRAAVSNPDAQVSYYPGASGGSGALAPLTDVHTTPGASTNDGFNVTYVTDAGEALTYDPAGSAFPAQSAVGTLPNQTCVTYPGFGTFCSGGFAYLGGTSVPLTNGVVSWSADYTGYLTVATAGDYEFNLAATGSARLYVDGKLAGAIDGSFLQESETFLVSLTAAEHLIEVKYATAGLNWLSSPSLSLGWSSSGSAIEQAVAGAAAADVAIVVVSDAESEGKDHSAVLPGGQNLLVERVAAVARKTIVVLDTGSGLVLPWADQVDAIVESWYGGQRMGAAIAAVLFGDVNPSGRSVVTFPASTQQWYAQSQSEYPGVVPAGGQYPDVHYDEGIFVGYRWFDQNGIVPLFPFGHGLSYTTFAYSDVKLSSTAGDGSSVTVSVNVTNTGSRAGAEVAQLYLGFPSYAGEPPRQLKGFEKVTLAAGASATVSFALDSRSFSIWDEATGAWVVPHGQYDVLVGASSRDIRGAASYTVR